MANKLNELLCLQTTGNTGVGSCFFDPKNIVGVMLCPKKYEIDISALQTNLIAATHNVTKLSRVFPIYDLKTPKDNTEQKTIQTFNTGAKQVVREGFNDWEFQYTNGGLSLHVELRKFNGSAFDFLFVDADNRLIGIAGSTSSKIRAIPSDGGFFWANPWHMNDASKVTEYMIQCVFNVRYLNDLVAFVKADFDISSTIYGLQDVVLTSESSGTPGTYRLTPKTKIGTNLVDLYSALASTTLVIAKNFLTGAAITVSTVTAGTDSNGDSCLVAALLTSDTDYPGVGEFLTLNLAAPATLQAAGIDGYESTGASKIVKN